MPQGLVLHCLISTVLIILLPVIIFPFATALSDTRGAWCSLSNVLKHDLASTCEILYVELPLQGCKIGGGIY